jgi:hypothetical protein
MANIRKNGKAYDAGDVSVELLGNLSDVMEIEYQTEQDHQLNYSLGSNDPSSWSRGKKTPSGSITMPMEDCVKLENAARRAGLDSILDIAPFDINVSYLNEFSQVVVDRVTAKFMNTGRKSANGDMRLSYQYNLFVLAVKQNNQFV